MSFTQLEQHLSTNYGSLHSGLVFGWEILFDINKKYVLQIHISHQLIANPQID